MFKGEVSQFRQEHKAHLHYMFILPQNLFHNIEALANAIKGEKSKTIRLSLRDEAFKYLKCPRCSQQLKMKAFIRKTKRLTYGETFSVFIAQVYCNNKDCDCGYRNEHKVSRYHLVQPDTFEPGFSYLRHVIEDYVAIESGDADEKDIKSRCGDINEFKKDCQGILKTVQMWSSYLLKFVSYTKKEIEILDFTVSILMLPRLCLFIPKVVNFSNALLVRFRTVNKV